MKNVRHFPPFVFHLHALKISSRLARGHEKCTYDEHNISKNGYLTFVKLSRSVDGKAASCLESDFLSVPSFYITFYDYSKLTPAR